MTRRIPDTKESAAAGTSPDTVCGAVAAAADAQLVVIDFDGTLLLRNSTEEYLRSVRPRAPATLLLAALSAVKPWRWTAQNGEIDFDRDWFRVFLCTILFPWSPLLWQRTSRRVADRFLNAPLAQALNASHGRIIIATQGFAFIVRPLVARMVKAEAIVACRFWAGRRDRRRGKLVRLVDALGPDAVAKGIAVTDNDDDLPLLNASRTPCHVVWPDANMLSAVADAYLPFIYMERIKRPGKQYLLRYVVGDDLPILLLATLWRWPIPWLQALGLLFLTASFWCIYELGYFENDLIASRHEDDPKIAGEFFSTHAGVPGWLAWAWASVFAAAGLFALDPGNLGVAALKWFGILAATRLVFAAYNHVDKASRKWLYLALQGLKHFGYFAVVATNFVGVALLAAQGLTRWLHYLVYRIQKEATGTRDNAWPKLHDQVIRLAIFGFLVVGMAAAAGSQDLSYGWQIGAALIWCGLRGFRDVKAVVTRVRRISHREPKSHERTTT